MIGELLIFSVDEKKRVFEMVIEFNEGKCIIVYGCGGNNIVVVVKVVFEIFVGVDGIFFVVFYYNKFI